MSQMIIEERPLGADLSGTDLHPILARIYSSRGVTSIEELEKGLDKLLPYKDLLGIDGAADRLVQALEAGEHIMIVGDFDADGATSTSLVVSALRSFGAAQVSFIVPNRFEYGYGLSPEIVEEAAKQQPSLIITVDNGISSVPGVEKARELGIEVVITDHHLAPEELPEAVAIVNPNQPGDSFASKNLAGVGVIFYVMMALRAKLRELGWFAAKGIAEPNLGYLLDLVALGTVADVVVLDHNNRVLVNQGLERMRAGRVRPGIRALLEVAGRDVTKLVASDLGFVVGPRLNAAGRLDDMSIGIECLLAEDEAKARELAATLDELNKERRAIEDQMKAEALQALGTVKLNSRGLPSGMCLYDEGWHQGVVGILAARIKERYHRPVIAFAKVSDQELKGSARSVQGVHIRDVLDAVATKRPELINKFGGHAMAAGLSIDPDQYGAFSEAFDQEVRAAIPEDQLCGKILTDGPLGQDDFTLRLAEILEQGGPWGQGFPPPIFEGVFELAQQRLLKERHLKMVLGVGDRQFVDAIAFNVDTQKWPDHHCRQVRAVYTLDINEWQGRRNIQLMIQHLEPCQTGN